MKHKKLFFALFATAFVSSALFTSCADEDATEPVSVNAETPPIAVGGLNFLFFTMYGLKDTTGIDTDSLHYYYDNPTAAGIPADNIVYVGKMYHDWDTRGTVKIYKQDAYGSWTKVVYPSEDGPTYWKKENGYIVYEANNEKLFLIRSTYHIDSEDVEAINNLRDQD